MENTSRHSGRGRRPYYCDKRYKGDRPCTATFEKGYQLKRHIMEQHEFLTCGIGGCGYRLKKKEASHMIRHRANHQDRDTFYKPRPGQDANIRSPVVDLKWAVPPVSAVPPRKLLDGEVSDTETVLYDPVDWKTLAASKATEALMDPTANVAPSPDYVKDVAERVAKLRETQKDTNNNDKTKSHPSKPKSKLKVKSKKSSLSKSVKKVTTSTIVSGVSLSGQTTSPPDIASTSNANMPTASMDTYVDMDNRKTLSSRAESQQQSDDGPQPLPTHERAIIPPVQGLDLSIKKPVQEVVPAPEMRAQVSLRCPSCSSCLQFTLVKDN